MPKTIRRYFEPDLPWKTRLKAQADMKNRGERGSGIRSRR